MAVLDAVEWGACLIEPHPNATVERELKQEFKVVPGAVVDYLSDAPWLARTLITLKDVGRLYVGNEMTDLIGLVVAEDNSCRYCYAMHRAMMRLQGFSTARIRELEESRFQARLDPHDALALEFARHVSRADPAIAKDRTRLRAVGWTDDSINEIAAISALNVFANRLATIPALPLGSIERLARFPGLDLLAPIARRFLAPSPARVPPLDKVECVGPWSFLIEALARLPVGRVLRRALDAACESPNLPRRSKLLVFAVIARALDCPQSEREAIRLLLEAGLDPDTIGEALRYLHSPHLTATESRIVGFARETAARYRPADIQRHARELETLLGRSALLELIGVTALANAVGRLGVVMGDVQ